jgi:hypothetical protein
MAKTSALVFRLTDDERGLCDDAAARRGVKVSAWVHCVCMAAALEVAPHVVKKGSRVGKDVIPKGATCDAVKIVPTNAPGVVISDGYTGVSWVDKGRTVYEVIRDGVRRASFTPPPNRGGK